VQAADGVKVEPRLTPALVQIDLQDLPKTLQGAQPGRAFAYRFPARPGEAVFDVQALEPRVSATHGNRIGIRPESIDLRCMANVTVERAGIFSLVFDLPADLEVSEVLLRGAELDDWTIQREAGKPTLLRVALRDRLMGKATVFIHGRSRISISEEEGAAAIEQRVPLVLLRGAHHVRGYVGVHIDPALDNKELDHKGLTPLDVGAPAACEPPALSGEAARLPLVYRYEHREGGVALTLELKRKAPTITCGVESWVRLEPGKTRMGALLRYHVAFRGVRTFRFKAPLELSKRMHLDTPGHELIGPSEEMKPEGAPENWQPTNGIWTVKLPAPRTGPVLVRLVIDDRPEEELKSGGRRSAAIPSFVPLEVEGKPLPNTVHFVAVRRDALLEVDVDTISGGEEIDARELPSDLQDNDNFLAFRSYTPEHGLSVLVTKHDYEPVADLVVSHMHLDTVVPVEGRATTEAFLVVRNNDRQYLRLKLPPGSNIRAVRVGEKNESPRVGEENTVLIPLLSGLGKDKAFLVAIYYDHDVARDGALFSDVRLVTPEPLEVKSDILTWRVFMPDGPVYTSFGGSVDPVDGYRSWAAKMLEGITSSLAVQDGAERLDVRRLIRSFQSPFTNREHKGRRFEFQGRVGTGDVRITSASHTFFLFWKLLWFAFALVGARLLIKLGAPLGLRPAASFSALMLLLLALLIPAGPGLSQVFTSMVFGVLLSGLISFFAWGAAGRAEAKAVALATKAIEDAAPPETPSAEGGVA